MKKVINGKMYNTDTAKELDYRQISNKSDFNFLCETLFQKKTGDYFLHGDGGALSIYSITENGSSSGSEKIIPFSEKQAKEWAEKHLNGDEYILIFGDVSE